jgi:hypothetical protein
MLVGMVGVQVTLGISTLLLYVPVNLAALHQVCTTYDFSPPPFLISSLPPFLLKFSNAHRYLKALQTYISIANQHIPNMKSNALPTRPAR